MKRTTSFLCWEEFDRLTRELHEERDITYYAIVLLGTSFALRIGDLLKLKWSDVMDDNGNVKDEMRVTEKKTGKERLITIADEAKVALGELRTTNKLLARNERIFPLTVQAVNRKLKRVFDKYEVDYRGNISTHLFRKTFGRRVYDRMEDKDKAITMLMFIFGHSDRATTIIYLGLRQEEAQGLYKDIFGGGDAKLRKVG